MTQAFSEGIFHSPEDTLPQKPNAFVDSDAPRTASGVIILGEDRHPRQLTPQMRRSMEFASHQPENFSAIDQQVDGFIGVLGRDLSEVQGATTDPAILIRQAEHLMKAAGQLIDGATDSKVAIRQRNQENLDEKVSYGKANEDLSVEAKARHQRILEVLLSNRAAREGLLQDEVAKQQASIDGFRQYLVGTDSSLLIAFDAHFSQQPKHTDVPEIEAQKEDDLVMPTTTEFEAHIQHVTDETMSPARGTTLLGLKVLAKLVIIPSKKAWGYLVPPAAAAVTDHEKETQLTQ